MCVYVILGMFFCVDLHFLNVKSVSDLFPVNLMLTSELLSLLTK